MDMDARLWEDCTQRHKMNMERQAAAQLSRKQKWEELEKAVGKSPPSPLPLLPLRAAAAVRPSTCTVRDMIWSCSILTISDQARNLQVSRRETRSSGLWSKHEARPAGRGQQLWLEVGSRRVGGCQGGESAVVEEMKILRGWERGEKAVTGSGRGCGGGEEEKTVLVAHDNIER